MHYPKYKCSYECDKAFAVKRDRDRHEVDRHHSNPGHYCPIDGCKRQSKPFKRDDNFLRHLEKVHGLGREEKNKLQVGRSNNSALNYASAATSSGHILPNSSSDHGRDEYDDRGHDSDGFKAASTSRSSREREKGGKFAILTPFSDSGEEGKDYGGGDDDDDNQVNRMTAQTIGESSD